MCIQPFLIVRLATGQNLELQLPYCFTLSSFVLSDWFIYTLSDELSAKSLFFVSPLNALFPSCAFPFSFFSNFRRKKALLDYEVFLGFARFCLVFASFCYVFLHFLTVFPPSIEDFRSSAAAKIRLGNLFVGRNPYESL